MKQKLKDLFAEMAALTWEKCKVDCRTPTPSCCSPEYCDMALEYAKENGIELEKPEGSNLLIGPNGCLAEPWLRPLCSFHICERSLSDSTFYKNYFELRERIDTLTAEEFFSKESN